MSEEKAPDREALLALAERVETAEAILKPGDWAVFCSRSYSCYMTHDFGVIDAVTPKTVRAKTGVGRRLHRYDRANVLPAASEEDARLICAQLDSAKAEAIRREREAEAYYKRFLGKTYARALAGDRP